MDSTPDSPLAEAAALNLALFMRSKRADSGTVAWTAADAGPPRWPSGVSLKSWCKSVSLAQQASMPDLLRTHRELVNCVSLAIFGTPSYAVNCLPNP